MWPWLSPTTDRARQKDSLDTMRRRIGRDLEKTPHGILSEWSVINDAGMTLIAGDSVEPLQILLKRRHRRGNEATMSLAR